MQLDFHVPLEFCPPPPEQNPVFAPYIYIYTGADTGFSLGGQGGGGQNSRGRGKSSDISKYRFLDVLNPNSYSNVRYNKQFTIFNDF